jgi:hypothetical protein
MDEVAAYAGQPHPFLMIQFGADTFCPCSLLISLNSLELWKQNKGSE